MRIVSPAYCLLLVAFCVSCTRPAPQPLELESEEVPLWDLNPRSEAGGDGEAEVRPLTAWDLLPVIDSAGPSGAIPDRVVIQFADDVVPESAVGGLTNGTSVSIEPAVPGRLVFTSPSTLEFTPRSSFAPDTDYRVQLEAVGTEDGLIRRPKEAGWSHRIKTPQFRFAGMNLLAFSAESGEVTLELRFTGAVAPDEAADHVRLEVGGGTIVSADWTATDDPRRLKGTVVGRGLKHRQEMRLRASAGLGMVGHSATLSRFSSSSELLEAERVEVLNIERKEGPTGFFIEVACDDAAAGGYRSWWYSDALSEWLRISPRCIPDPSSAKDFIEVEPAANITVAAAKNGFRILGDFERGTYTVTLKEGLVTEDGGKLTSARSRGVSIPARSPKVSFVSKGRYLPRSNWKNLGIRHLNVKSVDVTVRHVPRENLVFWLSGEREDADARNSNVVAERAVPVVGEPDVYGTSWLDLASLVPRGANGVYEVRLQGGESSDVSRLVVTDMNLVAKRSRGVQGAPGGDVLVWALGVHDNAPVPGARIDLIRRSGRVLGSCKTDLAGSCVISGRGDALDDSPPFALLARKGPDQTFLRFSDLRLDISEAFVQGEAYGAEKPYRLAVWSDRGAYRPGDTVHLAGLLRGPEGIAPEEAVPVRLVERDPHGNPVRRAGLASNPAGFVDADLEVDDFAVTGRYRAEFVIGDDVVARYGFHVEEFVPERMSVQAKSVQQNRRVDEETAVDVSARYLFGGSAQGSATKLSCSLRPSTFRPKENGAFHYGPWSEDGVTQSEISLGTSEGVLDASGSLRMVCPTGAGGTLKLDGVAEIVARAEVFEAGSGRSSTAVARSRVFAAESMLGLATGTPRFKGGKNLDVQGVLVDWEGKTRSGNSTAEVELFLLEAEYGWMYDRRTGAERFRRYLRRVADGKRALTVADGRFVLPITPSRDAAGYLVRVHSGDTMSELYIEGEASDYWWWGGRDTVDETPRPLKPGSLELQLPDELRVGERATVRFDAPYAGRVLMTVETDTVLESRWVSVEAGPVEWTFTPRRFAPNLYVSALLLKDPHLDSPESFTPARAFGVRSAPVRPEDFVQTITLDAPEEILPGEMLEVGVQVTGGTGPSWVALAAVDPGILSLTGFSDPDPNETIFAPRALGVESFETVGWTLLLPPPGNGRAVGGGSRPGSARVQMVKPVALWSGIVPLDSAGRATIPLKVPRHRGALRLMAVAASAQEVGTASGVVLVREPLVLQPTTPRFVVEGDEFEIPVFVTNTTEEAQDVRVSVEAERMITGTHSVSGGGVPVRFRSVVPTLTLGPGESGRALFVGQVDAKRGGVRITVAAEGGPHRSEADFTLPIESAKPLQRRVRRVSIESGTTDLAPLLAGWEEGTDRSSLWVTSNPYADVFEHLRFLVRYPYGCIEQTTSTTRPLLYVGNTLRALDPGAVGTDGVDAKLAAGLRRILSMQTPVGGFSYWPGGGSANAWGTAYATHFLIEAIEAGHDVPAESLESALKWLEGQVGNGGASARPYMHYVLARAGRARKAQAADLLDSFPTEVYRGGAQEKVYLLKAALWLAGDRRFEKELRSPVLPSLTDDRAGGWDWYSDRRRRGLMLNVMVDLFGADPSVDGLAGTVAESLRGMSSRSYTTQELAWGVSGLGRWARAVSDESAAPTLSVGGQVQAPSFVGLGAERSWTLPDGARLTDPSLHWDGAAARPTWLVVSSRGVLKGRPAPTGGNGLSVSRTWQRASGRPLLGAAGRVAPSQLGDVLYTTIHLSNRTKSVVDNVALVDRVPAGWEIENPRIGGRALPDWLDLDTRWRVDHLNVRDDRVEVFGSVAPGQTVSFSYAARAVTAGSFAVPPVEAEAMYDPRLWARESGQKVVVEGPWAALMSTGD